MDAIEDLNVRTENLRNEIVKFIEAHPGAIKQELDNYIIEKGSGSKKTIQRELRFLVEEEKSVRVWREKANSARHRLYINSDNVVRSALNDVANIRDSFFKLLYEVESASAAVDRDKVEPISEIYLAQKSLRILFEHMLLILVLYFLFEWPRKISDDRNLDRLYSLTFKTIKDIGTEISKSLPGYLESDPARLQQKLVDRLFVLNPRKLYGAVTNLKTVGINEQTETAIDALWKFSSPFVPWYTHPEPIIEKVGNKRRLVKDWKKAVKATADEVESNAYQRVAAKCFYD